MGKLHTSTIDTVLKCVLNSLKKQPIYNDAIEFVILFWDSPRIFL